MLLDILLFLTHDALLALRESALPTAEADTRSEAATTVARGTAYVIVVALGLLIGAVLGFIVGVVTGIIPFSIC